MTTQIVTSADPLLAFQDMLIGGGFTTATRQVWSNYDDPPETWQATGTTEIVLPTVRGGFGTTNDDDATRNVSLQCKLFGVGSSHMAQRHSTQALADDFYLFLTGDNRTAYVMSANMVSQPVILSDGAGRPFALAYVDVMLKNNVEA